MVPPEPEPQIRASINFAIQETPLKTVSESTTTLVRLGYQSDATGYRQPGGLSPALKNPTLLVVKEIVGMATNRTDQSSVRLDFDRQPLRHALERFDFYLVQIEQFPLAQKEA